MHTVTVADAAAAAEKRGKFGDTHTHPPRRIGLNLAFLSMQPVVVDRGDCPWIGKGMEGTQKVICVLMLGFTQNPFPPTTQRRVV